MNESSVCCLLLTADRQRLTDRAVRCFLAQTVQAELVIYDTGKAPYELSGKQSRVVVMRNESSKPRKIGALRNEALDMVKADVIIHWDSDDWSDPERIACQLTNLEGYEAAGYHNLLFLDTRKMPAFAWDYDYKRWGPGVRDGHVVGSSLAYRRETWARQPFSETLNVGEDSEWCKRVAVNAVNGVGVPGADEPLLIAEVHGQNMSLGSSYYVFDKYDPAINPEWRRAPEWDTYCRERLYS